MNPRLPQHVIDKALAEDKAKASAEYLNIWREDIADFLPLDVIEAATEWGVHERPPQPNTRYVAFCDSAGGTGSFALTIAHVENDAARSVVVGFRRGRPWLTERWIGETSLGVGSSRGRMTLSDSRQSRRLSRR